MTASDFENIEKALGFPLPEHYKRFMLNYPPELLQAKPADWDPITDWEFADNPRRIVQMNQYVRKQPPGHFVDDGPWPERFFVIGEEEGGNYYAIDRSGEDERVWMCHHEDGQLAPMFTQTLEEFSEWLIDYFWQFKEEEAP
jgi:hypothetical protein